MSHMEQENEIRMNILDSLSRSQKALARIIESMGDTAGASAPVSRRMLESIDVIGRYQLAIGDKIAGMRIRRIRHGEPEPPWLNQDVRSSR